MDTDGARNKAKKFDQKMAATNDSYDFDALLTKASGGFPNIINTGLTTSTDFGMTSLPFQQPNSALQSPLSGVTANATLRDKN